MHAVGAFDDFDDPGSDTASFSMSFNARHVGEDGVTIPTEDDLETCENVYFRTTGGGLRGEGTCTNGWKSRGRVGRDGVLRVTLLNENKRWAGDGVSNLGIASDAGVAALAIESATQTFVTQTDVDLSAVGLLEVESHIEMADGSTITRTEIVDPTPEPAAPALTKITARQTGAGDAKLVTITQGEGLTLAVELSDAETGEAVISTVDETPISTVRMYETAGVEFEPGEDPAEYVYLTLIDLIDGNGDPVGEQYEIELTIPAQGEGTVNTVPFGDGLGLVFATHDAEGITLSVSIANTAAVDSVNLIFEEPFEGPAPLETEVNAFHSDQLNKWVQKGQAALPANFTVATVLTNAEGEVVGGVTASGAGTGKVAGSGSSTKKSPTYGGSISLLDVATSTDSSR